MEQSPESPDQPPHCAYLQDQSLGSALFETVHDWWKCFFPSGQPAASEWKP